MKEFNDVSINENNEEKKEEKNNNLPKMTFDWRTDEWPEAFDVQNRMRVLGYTAETQSVVIDILVKMHSLKNLGLTTSDDEEMMGKANEVLNIALSEKPTFTNEGVDDLFSDAYSFLDTFNDYTDLKSFKKEDNKEIKEEPKKETVVNNEAPKKEVPPIINTFEYAANEDFEIEDPAGIYPVKFIAQKGNMQRDSLLEGFDDKDKTLQEKRNMLVSYVMQGMTQKAIIENVHKIQQDKNLSGLFDEYVKVVDKADVIKDHDRLLNTMTFKINGLSLNGKVNAVKRQKQRLEDDAKKNVEERYITENEIDKFNRRMKELDERDKQDNVDQNIVNKEIDENQIIEPRNNAAAFIENIRDNGFPVFNPSQLTEEQKNLYADNILKILAVRQLADSERGKKDKLVRYEFTDKELNDRVAEMKEDPVFGDFINKIKQDPDLMKKAILAAQANLGHGGKLDDMLKDYMLNLPPGEFHNDKLHDRYLPTIKERIEYIQKQYKRAMKAMKQMEVLDDALEVAQKRRSEARINELIRKKEKLADIVENFYVPKAVAEIVALRNYAKADLGKKNSLNKKIPSFDNDPLQEELGKVYSTQSFQDICQHEAVLGMLAMGHGGDMTALVREMEAEQAEHDPYVTALLEKNTIGYRLNKTIKDEAKDLAEKIDASVVNESADVRQLTEKGKLMIMEYMHLTMKAWNSDYKNVDKELLIKDVPWGEMDKLKRTGLDYDKDIKDFLKDFKAEDTADVLRMMNDEKSPKEFIKKVKVWKQSLEPARQVNNNNRRPNNEIKIGGQSPSL